MPMPIAECQEPKTKWAAAWIAFQERASEACVWTEWEERKVGKRVLMTD